MNVLIKAYTNLNLGDDLFIKILCDRYRNVNFKIVASPSKAKVLKNIPNLTVLYPYDYEPKKYFARLRKIHLENQEAKKSDATVHIGGSIYIQSKRWRLKVWLYKLLIKNSKNFFVIGANFGPFETRRFRRTYEKLFEEVDDVCFRDNLSYSLFNELDNVRVASDTVFSLDFKEANDYNQEKSIVVSVIDLNKRKKLSKYTEIYEQIIERVTIELINLGYRIILMSFCENEGDLKAINRIISKIDNRYHSKIEVYNYRNSLTNSLSIIKKSDGVIATRFHSLILAMIFDKPVYPFIYSNKTANYLNDIEYQGNTSWISKIGTEDVPAIAGDIIYELQNKTDYNINKQINDANFQFLALDNFLLNTIV